MVCLAFWRPLHREEYQSCAEGKEFVPKILPSLPSLLRWCLEQKKYCGIIKFHLGVPFGKYNNIILDYTAGLIITITIILFKLCNNNNIVITLNYNKLVHCYLLLLPLSLYLTTKCSQNFAFQFSSDRITQLIWYVSCNIFGWKRSEKKDQPLKLIKARLRQWD